MRMATREQVLICERAGVAPDPPPPNSKLGVARNVRDGIYPLNGLRHRAEDDTCGWYLWAGEELSSSTDFFVPLHVDHLPIGALR
jgi:hypothetical protein